MLTTAAARKAILGAMPAYEKEAAAVAASTGKVLRQKVVAERDQPPFDRVTMDGVAISYADVENGTREFPIQATQAAGDTQLSLEVGKAIEIMTGASLPVGADCIVPVERISVSNDVAALEAGYEVEQNQFIHPRGSDHTKGTELLSPGKRISPMDIAIINSCGLTDVESHTRSGCRTAQR
jgi:molybdopterin molybdotransferase